MRLAYLAVYRYARSFFQGLRLDAAKFGFTPWPSLVDKEGKLTEEGRFFESVAREAFRNKGQEQVALLPALWAALAAARWFRVGFRQGVAYHESQDPETQDSIGDYIDAQYFPAGINIPPKYQAAVCDGFSRAIGVPVRLEGRPGHQRFEVGLGMITVL